MAVTVVRNYDGQGTSPLTADRFERAEGFEVLPDGSLSVYEVADGLRVALAVYRSDNWKNAFRNDELQYLTGLEAIVRKGQGAA